MYKKITPKSIALAAFIFIGHTVLAQTQIGNDIDGEATGDRSGFSVSMPDATTVAIGAPQNDANGGSSGHVRVYSWTGSSWTQKGADLDGEAAGDLFGGTVSMPDANTLAVGAPQNDVGDTDSGQVKIFQWDGASWIQKGSTLQGTVTSGFFGGLFGSSVSMPNPNSVAVGASWFDTTGTFSGQVKIFDWNGSDWVQRGASINGTAYSYTGSIVKMPSSNVVGIVTQGATPGNKGKVQVYEWNGSLWSLKGNPIEGENPGDLSGSAMDMPDENTIAIAAIESDGSFPQAGHVRIFTYNGSSWVQKGTDIDGEAQGDQSGNSVSMPDANTIAIGAILNDGNGSQSGHVRVFRWDGTSWLQDGNDIDGEAALDHSGYSVSMPNANTVAIGAIQNDAVNGSLFKNESGHVRIFNIGSTLSLPENNLSLISAYPNPTNGDITIHFNETLKNVEVTVRNTIGQTIYRNQYGVTKSIPLTLQGTAGLYFIEITSENKKTTLKVMKQ